MEKLIIEDFYENLGMNKHDLFLIAVEGKENFTNVVSKICDETELHFPNKKIRIKIIWKEEMLEKAVYIVTEIKNETMEVFYAHEEFFHYLLIYYLENMENFETEREAVEKGLENYYNKMDKERREPPVIDLKNLFDRFH